jgi:hypothetical protein
MGVIGALVLAVALSAPAGEQAAPPAGAPAWELVGNLGRVKTVYVDPARIKDKQILASAVKNLLDKAGRQSALEVNFFDDRVAAPRTLPFPPGSRRHHRAKFNFNPANGMKKFVWVQPADPAAPDGKPKYTEDSLEVD